MREEVRMRCEGGERMRGERGKRMKGEGEGGAGEVKK